MAKFKLGDRVTRLEDVFDETSKLMHGRVCRVYSDYDSTFGPYPEIYDVVWDHKHLDIDRGFLPHGLDNEIRLLSQSLHL